jgi:hypothetical protein
MEQQQGTNSEIINTNPTTPSRRLRLAASTKASCRALTNSVRLAVRKNLIIHQGFLADQRSQLLFCA